MSELKLSNRDIYLLEGPQKIEVKSGSIEVVGARVEAGDGLEIPRGKTIPVEGRPDATIDASNVEDEKLEQLDQRTIPESWDELVEETVDSDAETIMIIGEMDTGKTFFSTYLTNSLLNSHDSVGVMDCDIGQSDIGPPAAIGTAMLEEPAVALDTVGWDELAFVGAHSPGLHLVPFLSGIRHLTDRALEQNDVLIVDTTGWVQGDGGRTVKQGKIDMLDPDKIVLLQKDNELEHLVKTISEERVKRVKVSDKVTPTPSSERQGLRERSMKNYMADARLKKLDLNDFGLERVYYGSGSEIQVEDPDVIHAEKLSGFEGILVVANNELSSSTREKLSAYGQIKTVSPDAPEGLVVGLTTEDNVCIGLGVVESLDFVNKEIKIHTPVEDPGNAYRIQFGSLRYQADGTENGFIEPGEF